MTLLEYEDTQNNSLFFASTQMQLAYEESERIEQEAAQQNQYRSQLKKFNSQDSRSQTGVNVKIVEKKITKKNKNNVQRTRGPKKNRIKSLSAHVEKVFGLKQQPESINKDSQQSILRYFSGKKRKVNEILNQLGSCNEDSDAFEISRDHHHSSIRATNAKFPYNREEWVEIIDTIKENLPNLSNATKRTLSDLTHRIEEDQMFTQSKIEECTQSGQSNLWENSSYHPSTQLTANDIKSLYDLNSDQMQLENINTEVHSFESIKEKDEEIIDDSCSEPELIDTQFLNKKQKLNLNSEIDNLEDSEHEDDYKSPKEIIELASSESDDAISDRENIRGAGSLSVQEIDDIASLDHKEFKELELDKTQPHEVTSSMNSSQDVVMSSSVASSPIKSAVSTPRRSKSKTENLLRKLLETPTRGKDSNHADNFNISPLKLTPPQFSSSLDTNYATASSQFPKDLSHTHRQTFMNPDDHKKYHTRVIEVSSDIDFKDTVCDDYKIRKIGKKSRYSNEDEVLASDNDENDISIIEISSLMDDNNPKPIETNLNNWEGNSSILQVPSSPNAKAISTTQDNEDVFGSKKTESVGKTSGSEFNLLSAGELKNLLKEWGLKPAKSKAKMVEILTNTNRIIESENPTQLSQIEFTGEMFQKLTEKIKNNKNWLEKINSFEPIVIVNLQRWLESEGFNCELALLQHYCDNLGICYTYRREDQDILMH